MYYLSKVNTKMSFLFKQATQEEICIQCPKLNPFQLVHIKHKEDNAHSLLKMTPYSSIERL